MGIITGGNVITGNAIAGSKARVTYTEALPTDANVAGSTGRTPLDGELAENVTNGNMYERQGGVWTRIDTLSVVEQQQVREAEEARAINP